MSRYREKKKTDLSQPIQIIPGDVRLTRCWLQSLQLRQLLVKHLPYAFGHLQSRRPLPELLNQLVLPIALHTQLLLDPLELLHQIVFPLPLRNLRIHVPRQFGLKLSIDQFLFEDKEGFTEAIIDNERFEYVLELLNFSGGDGSCKVREFVWFVEYVRGDLVDGKVGYLVAEEGVELGDIFEDGHDLRHEGANILVIFVVR